MKSRNHFKLNRICSSDNYELSRKIHFRELTKSHEHFCALMISGELSFDIPKPDNSGFRNYTIKGKQMLLTVEEYSWYQKNFGK